jgi:hypothetical protein
VREGGCGAAGGILGGGTAAFCVETSARRDSSPDESRADSDCRRECARSTSAAFADVRLSALSSAARSDSTADESRAIFSSERESRPLRATISRSRPSARSSRDAIRDRASPSANAGIASTAGCGRNAERAAESESKPNSSLSSDSGAQFADVISTASPSSAETNTRKTEAGIGDATSYGARSSAGLFLKRAHFATNCPTETWACSREWTSARRVISDR